MKTEVYLAHALSQAPDEFRRRMLSLRYSLNEISGLTVLEFNWIPGKGPDLSINTYQYDMDMLKKARLMVGILEYPSIGLGMEIQERCRLNAPMLLFYPKDSRLSQIVPDCLEWHRSQSSHWRMDASIGYESLLKDPIPYTDDYQILDFVRNWVTGSIDPWGIEENQLALFANA